MAQVFRTTQQIAYRNHPRRRVGRKLTTQDRFISSLPPQGNWIKTIAPFLDKDNPDEIRKAENTVKKMYEDRMTSTYRNDYRNRSPYKMSTGVESHDEFFKCAQLLYDENRNYPILPPVPTGRTMLGYLPPRNCYGPLSMYQKVHDKLGYERLSAAYGHR